MRREEKRRKFHEAVLNTLYPPPPSPPPPQGVNGEEKPIDTISEDFHVELINPDDYIRSSNSSGDDDDDDDEGSECDRQKLTRVQRKRLRKKKLREDASRRSKIIGPLLPPRNNDDNGGGEIVSPGVRQNADEECAITNDKPREITGCSDQKKKLKNRRKAKKLGRERLKCSSEENCSKDKKNDETCD